MRVKLYDANGDYYEYQIVEISKEGEPDSYRVDYKGDCYFTPAYHLCAGAFYETESGAAWAILNEYATDRG